MGFNIKHPDLLQGVVDIHLHIAPSLIPRRLDIVEMANLADKAGYKAIVQKDHHALTAHCAKLIKKHHFANSKLQILGAICLNNSVGGLKKEVVETAIGFGARIVWLPTVSAKNHIAFVKRTGKFPKLAKGITIDETPIPFVDADGNCRKEIIDIFEVIRKFPDVVIATGHGDPNEMDVIIAKAAELGLADRIIVDHPTWMVEASFDQVARWAKLGCFIEHPAAMSIASSSHYDLPMEDIVHMIKMVGPEKTILSYDYGQADNGDPIEAMDEYFDTLMGMGISRDEIVLMSNTNPSTLLGLD